MAPHSSTLAWRVPWTEEPGRLQSMGLLRVGHDWATSLGLLTFMHWRRKWQPTPVFLPENPRDGGAWWAAIYRVAQSRTQLRRLSSSSRVNTFRVERERSSLVELLFLLPTSRLSPDKLRCASILPHSDSAWILELDLSLNLELLELGWLT